MPERLVITEWENVQQEWYAAARAMTVAKLPEFVRHLTEDYDHDYGTLCHAVAAAALAAAHAVNHSPTGGITGFQAEGVMWQFVVKWLYLGGEPLRLVHYREMLYPQYDTKFAKTITSETWRWLQAEAAELLPSGLPLSATVGIAQPPVWLTGKASSLARYPSATPWSMTRRDHAIL